MTRRRQLMVLLIVASLATACRDGRAPAGSGQPAIHARGRVRIAAASDLRFALDAILAQRQDERPELDVRVSYGSSGTFFAQITNGAPFDLFLSADEEYPRQLMAA